MAGLRPYIFGRPDACNRLHAPRRGGASVGLLSLPGRCRTRCETLWATRSRLLVSRAVCGRAGRRGSEEARKARQRTMHMCSGRARNLAEEGGRLEGVGAGAEDVVDHGHRVSGVWMVPMACWRPPCRWRRARDAGVVLEREDAWRRRAELEGLLESAAAQHVARSYRRCRAMR